MKINFEKIINNSLITLGVIAIFMILIIGSFSTLVFYKGFYYSEYHKNNVYKSLVTNNYSENVSNSQMLAEDVTNNLVSYMRGKSELKYFSQEEKSHLRDVKFIISGINFIYYSSVVIFLLILIIFYYKFKSNMGFVEKLSKMVLYGSITSLTFIVAILLLIIFFFQELFLLMHVILFPQGNWMFDQTSLLITLFPNQFFINFGLRIFIYALFQSIIFLIIGIWLRKHVTLQKKFKTKIN